MLTKILNTLRQYPVILYLVVVTLGILVGLSHNDLLQRAGMIISGIFIRLFRLISAPIIVLSIIVTLSTYQNDGSLPNVWRKTIPYTVSTTVIAAAISCILFLIIEPQSVNQITAPTVKVTGTEFNYFKHIASLIPTNILTPFIEQQVISILMIGIAIGIATRFIPNQEGRLTLIQFFQGLYGVFFVITKWLIAILPLGLFGFVVASMVQFKNGVNIAGIGQYILIIIAANLIQGLMILPLWLKSQGIKPFIALKAMLPALSVAFFSKSSAGTLPVTIETAERNLKINPQISRFVLPLCTSLNMNGCAAFIFTTVIYLMQNQGIDISLLTMVMWIFIASIAAIGNAGVPMGCFFLSASLLSSMDISIVLLGIILPFYSVIDMIETALNVWSDSCVAQVVNENYLQREPKPN